MEPRTKEKRPNPKSKLIADSAMLGLKIFAQGAITGLGMKFGAGLYEKMGAKSYRASVTDLRKQG